MPLPDPDRFLQVQGDQLIYCQGRLAWYFLEPDGLYWVTRPDFYPHLPCLELLEEIRKADRARLANWIGVRDAQRTAQVAEELQRSAPRPPPAREPVLEKVLEFETATEHVERLAREQEEDEKARAKEVAKLNAKLRREMAGLSAERRRELAFEEPPTKPDLFRYMDWGNHYQNRPDFGEPWSLTIVEMIRDHDWIESMFALYSQQRYRLL